MFTCLEYVKLRDHHLIQNIHWYIILRIFRQERSKILLPATNLQRKSKNLKLQIKAANEISEK